MAPGKRSAILQMAIGWGAPSMVLFASINNPGGRPMVWYEDKIDLRLTLVAGNLSVILIVTFVF